ncbi:unannotated protein [freshwater metagenome]|uniref:Unannotated protein n=1 Tax=freshwater metagenome TaxID=449393 RepID=A0A6J6E7D8_9ZZZZ|nr:DUF3046 domain-containing protein [Actinomycetota bacterium]
MTLSRFFELVQDEFGEQLAEVILSDTRLDHLADQTPRQLIQAGEDPKAIWLAICDQLNVPADRRQGKNKSPRHAE